MSKINKKKDAYSHYLGGKRMERGFLWGGDGRGDAIRALTVFV